MKHIIEKLKKSKLIFKLHQLQKRLKRAEDNGYPEEKVSERKRKILELQEMIRNAKGKGFILVFFYLYYIKVYL